MQDPSDVIVQAADGHIKELAEDYEVSTRRMLEILGPDNPYPKTKRLIRKIARRNRDGARFIRQDMEVFWADILDEIPAEAPTAGKLHKELNEAVSAKLEGKAVAERMRECREAMAELRAEMKYLETLKEERVN